MDAKWIITVFVRLDDYMRAVGHKTHYHARLADSEILTFGLIAAKYFNNNHKLTLLLLAQTGYLKGKNQLDPSRFNRRLHALADWFELLLAHLAETCRPSTIFVIDSRPVPVCKWVRRWRSGKLRGRQFCGYCAAKTEQFFGYRLQLVCTPKGLPVAFSLFLLPASLHDLTPIHELT